MEIRVEISAMISSLSKNNKDRFYQSLVNLEIFQKALKSYIRKKISFQLLKGN